MVYVSPWYRTYSFHPDRIARSPSAPQRKVAITPIEKRPLSPRQKQALYFIRAHVAEHGVFPMAKQVRWEFGSGEAAFADKVLYILMRKGYIAKLPPGTRDEKGKIVRWRLVSESCNSSEHGKHDAGRSSPS